MSHAVWDHLRFQTRLRPHALAIYGAAGPVTYRALAHDVDALATELMQRGLSRQDLVGLHLDLSYLHLLLILALDRLSIPSMSFPSPGPLPPAAILRQQLDLTAMVSAAAEPVDPPCRWLQMAGQERPRLGTPDQTWLAQLDSPADCLVRVGWSSGTTGGVKGSPITRKLQGHRIAARRLARALGPRTRYLTGVPFSSAPGYVMPLAVLAAGGVVILRGAGADFVELANALRATMTSGPPALLAELVGDDRGPARRLETVELFMVSGTHLPGQLAREARLRLTPNIWIGYGATETDGVAIADSAVGIADPTAVGYLFPWVEAETVDAAGRPLPVGGEGTLRLRCAQMIAGYYKDAAATARNFRDGWFYPGDVGAITGQGLLRITGRIEDVILRDGFSLSPLPIEEAIRGFPGVRDVAVFALTGADGGPTICAALVLEPGTAPQAVQAFAAAQLGDRAPTRLFVIDSLPRNASGKVLRRQLVQRAAHAVRP